MSGFDQAEFGVKGSKKINRESIELHIAVDKIIDWSTSLEYRLPRDIFSNAHKMNIKPYFEENNQMKPSVMVAPMP